MSAKDLISNEIPVLTPALRISEALVLMDELKVNALPLAENGRFLTLVTERNLLLAPDLEEEIGTPPGFPISVSENAHLFDILNRITQSEADILPVVDENSNYKGAIPRIMVLRQLAQYCDVTSPGAIIRLEMNPADFILSEIARLAEQNNTRIINFFSFTDFVSGKLQVFIKVDREDPTHLLRSLERFSYQVIETYMHDQIMDDAMQRRIEELLYYIEM